MSYKRNRSGNFTNEEIELLQNLVEEHKALVDSAKQEDKKKVTNDISQTFQDFHLLFFSEGWELITDSFNTSCTTPREVSVLRMKLKNLKAQKRRLKMDDGDATAEDENEGDSEQDESVTSKKSGRKRTKIFNQHETQLLQDLFDEHIGTHLDSSLSRESMEAKYKAWGVITEEFNKANVSEIPRETQELKIKYKNMKAFRTNQLCKSEAAEPVEEAVLHILPESSVVRKLRPISQPATQSIKIISSSTVSSPQKSRVYDIVMESDEPEYEYIEDCDDDDIPLVRKTNPEDDKEMERIRKENLLLKNSVLRKKERLLELQISLAERNLRRHQL